MIFLCIYCGDPITNRLIAGAFCSEICQRIFDRENPPSNDSDSLPF